MKKFSIATFNLLNADVLIFQELWHAESIRNAFSRLSLAGGYRILAPEDTAGKKIVCEAAGD